MKEAVLQQKHGQRVSLPTSQRSEAAQPLKGCETACVQSGWTEKRIAYALATHYFKNRSILYVPNCNFSGAEADVLVVEMSRKLIDVEIKISRQDFKADAKKQKWWRYLTPDERIEKGRETEIFAQERTDWPVGVWKHIYVMPAQEWKDDLLDHMASDKSGVVLIHKLEDGRIWFQDLKKPEKNKDARILSEREVLNIARLANIRMWQTYQDIEKSPTWRLS